MTSTVVQVQLYSPKSMQHVLPADLVLEADRLRDGAGSQQYPGTCWPVHSHYCVFPQQDLLDVLGSYYTHRRVPEKVRLVNGTVCVELFFIEYASLWKRKKYTFLIVNHKTTFAQA